MSLSKHKIFDEDPTALADYMVINGYDFVYEKIFNHLCKELDASVKNVDCILMDACDEFVEKARSVAEYDDREKEKVTITKEGKSMPLTMVYYDLACIMRKLAHYARRQYLIRGKNVTKDKRFLTLIKY